VYPTFYELFKNATQPQVDPYPYQIDLANQPWPDLIKIPTGMGKTAGIILSWVFKRLIDDPDTPRRLVYCLPMRVLVEQTASNAVAWIDSLVKASILDQESRPSVHILMGGEIDKDWDRSPERNAILVGTQDQLLSRALNRGYSMSRFRWPMHFAFLNNDCLWVLDEAQLMGSGLSTTAQLQAFRNHFGSAIPVKSLWMSATLNRKWLSTIDFKDQVNDLKEFQLSEKDEAHPEIKKRLSAKKTVEKAAAPYDDPKAIATMIKQAHRAGTRTLAVFNTVDRALNVYQALKKMSPKASLILLHSRFRPGDREKALRAVLADPTEHGSVCISTQVIEAGVDLSATSLITDLAPWDSLVQRFGRCNRQGKDDNARVIWLEIDTDKKSAALPYSEEDLREAAEILHGLQDASPKRLPPVSQNYGRGQLVRRKDLMDLFDTTPDLAGYDLDVSAFIRDSDDHDVQVFWRDLPEGQPDESEPSPSQEELCSVSVNALSRVRNLPKWRWDHLEKRWTRSETVIPGMIFMLPTSAGCYSAELGWTGVGKDLPPAVNLGMQPEEANDDDFSAQTAWRTLAEHADDVVTQVNRLLSSLCLDNSEWVAALRTAARWHDAGKAHPVFQKAMVGDPPEVDPARIWAKTARRHISYARRGFRHELASALMMLEQNLGNLPAYLAAAHHGKIRLSIRSLPTETKPESHEIRYARGIWDGDLISEADLGGGYSVSQTTVDLSCMELGQSDKYGPSWLDRVLALLDQYGPFTLAFLEALLRVADWEASSKGE